MKEDAHSAEENYIVHEQREIYWINEEGLLIKRQSYGEFEWTIDGIADIYTFDTTVELTGYNYKKLTEIGDELSPVSYTHLRAHETRHDLVCRLLLEKKK